MLPPRLVRRVVLAPLTAVIAIALAVLVPLFAALSAASRLAGLYRRGYRRVLRLMSFALIWLTADSAVLFMCLGLWVVSGFGGRLRTVPYQSRHYAIMRWFLDLIYRAAARLFGLRVEVDEPEPAPAELAARLTRPVIVLSRHAGPGDSFLLVHQLLSVYGRRPRVVIKAALQLDPGLDVVANRLPNVFISRRQIGEKLFIAQIERLAGGLDEAGALVIFPEGGNWTPRRWRRGIRRLEEGGRRDLAARAREMPNLLAPRTGGALAAIAACPAADVIFVAHAGLDRLVSAADIWRSLPMDHIVRARWWRVPADCVPRAEAREAQVQWLYDWWQRIDTWISENRPVGADTGGKVREIGDAAPLAAAALQRWYGADRYARRTGLYSYADPSLDVRWGGGIFRVLVNAAIALSGQRGRVQDSRRWWNAANAITAVIGYMSVTGDRSYLVPVVENTFARAPRAHRGFINAFYDDEGWWALAWIAAYDLTGAERYLAAADEIFQDMTGGWDDVWGGGIYWGKNGDGPDRAGKVAVPRGWTGPYKNAIANGLFIAIAAALGVRHQRRDPSGAGHRGYLDWARRGWEWFSSPRPAGVAMMNAAGLVNDSPNRMGVNDNTQSIWSYNQGVILGALADLTALTEDPAYLGRAAELAGAFIANPWYAVPRPGGRIPPPSASGVIDGILHEHNECDADGAPARGGASPGVDSTMFKGIFVRNLARLHTRAPNPGYRDFILANARSALEHMNERHLFGCNWAAGVDVADFVRQTAGLDLLNAALLVSEGGPR